MMLTIVGQDRSGLLADVSEALAEADVNIDNIDAARVRAWAVVLLEVSDEAAALQALAQADLTAFAEPVLLVCLDDRPGALARMAKRLKDAQVEINSLRIVGRESTPAGRHSLVALCTEQTEAATELLAEMLVPPARRAKMPPGLRVVPRGAIH